MSELMICVTVVMTKIEGEGKVEKVDLKKDLKHLYNPSVKEVTLVDVPPMNFVMIDGSVTLIKLRNTRTPSRLCMPFPTPSSSLLRKTGV